MAHFPVLLQVGGGLAVLAGLFLVLSPGLAVLVMGALTVAAGIVLEVGSRPRQVPPPAPSPNGTGHAWLHTSPSQASER